MRRPGIRLDVVPVGEDDGGIGMDLAVLQPRHAMVHAPGNSRISGCSEPPNATFISWKPRQMPKSGTPRATQASTSASASASRASS